MTTEELIETYIQQGMCAYKKLNRNSPEGRKLERHEAVTIEGIEFSCWREYAVYKVAECIHDALPDVKLEVELDGNSSALMLEITEDEQKKLDKKMSDFLTGVLQ